MNDLNEGHSLDTAHVFKFSKFDAKFLPYDILGLLYTRVHKGSLKICVMSMKPLKSNLNAYKPQKYKNNKIQCFYA